VNFNVCFCTAVFLLLEKESRYLFAMSIVTVQLGQCGNQIGSQFFSTVASDLQSSPSSRHSVDYEDQCLDRFFSLDEHGKATARAVMVDTEPKVSLLL